MIELKKGDIVRVVKFETNKDLGWLDAMDKFIEEDCVVVEKVWGDDNTVDVKHGSESYAWPVHCVYIRAADPPDTRTLKDRLWDVCKDVNWSYLVDVLFNEEVFREIRSILEEADD